MTQPHLAVRQDRSLRPEKLRRILVTGCGLFGDAILSSHALHSLHSAFPRAAFDLVAPAYVGDLYRQILPFEKHFFWEKKNNCQTVRQIKKENYDLAFILRGGFEHALAARAAGIPHRLGFSSDRRGFLLTGHVGDSKNIHNHQNFLNLLKTLPSAIPERTFRFPFEKKVPNKPYFAIAPNASEPSKTWDLRSFIAVVKNVVERTDWTPVYLGQKNEWAYTEILRLATGGENLAGELLLPELFYRLGNARFFLGNNSGLAHLAGNLGTPALVVTGPSHPVFTKPFGERVYMIYRDVPGIPLEKRGGKKFRNKFPMSDVSVADVLGVLDASGILSES